MNFKLYLSEEKIQIIREKIGIELGKMKAALNMVKSGFPLDKVAEATKVDKKNLIAAAQAEGIKFEIK
jgi:hypothetical protein